MTFFKNVPKHSDFFNRLSYFHNVSKLSVYSETFRFVLGTFQNGLENFHDCSEIFRFVFGTFQNCSGTLRCFQMCSETF